MHGRLKVKSTAEQQEAKRKEKEKKLQIYRTVTTKIFEKRKNGDLDEELITLTGELLANVPEFSTLWNIRREIMESWSMTKTREEMAKLHANELYFLEQCLRTNPKCYSTWHQRCWIMDRMESPDWSRELALCSKFLEYDERNFHCWDYRRFVVQRHNVQPSAELEFTTNKITANFSNFSSWHYRSKLLPIVHPDHRHPTGVNEQALLHEFELVQNAFFTDPNDQSAWFYHRWLLGQGQQHLSIVDVCCNRSDKVLLVTLSRQAELGTDFSLDVSINGINTELKLCSSTGKSFGVLWIGDLSTVDWDNCPEQTISVALRRLDMKQIACEVVGKLDENGWYWKNADKTDFHFSCELSAATAATLTTELDSCRQLHDLEPDNKWVLLTLLSLMRALDPLQYQSEMLSYLIKLNSFDPLRSNYYADLRSKVLMEVAIESMPPNTQKFSLVGVELKVAHCLEYLCVMTSVDLSHNDLCHLHNGCHLRNVVELNLSDNRLVDCRGLESLPKLKVLNLSNNDIKKTSDLAVLASCPCLTTVIIVGNPVTQQPDFMQFSLGQAKLVYTL